MVRGKFGLPRPFAVENEFITYSVDTSSNIKKATASSANGVFINEELKPFFDIHSVDHSEIDNRGVRTNIRIEADDTFIDLSVFRVFTSNLDQVVNDSIFSDDVIITPSLIPNRPFGEVEQDPFLLLKLTSNRIDEEGLDRYVKNAESLNYIVTAVESEVVDGEARAYFLSQGVELGTLSDMEFDFGAPENKNTVAMEITTLAVDLENI